MKWSVETIKNRVLSDVMNKEMANTNWCMQKLLPMKQITFISRKMKWTNTENIKQLAELAPLNPMGVHVKKPGNKSQTSS